MRFKVGDTVYDSLNHRTGSVEKISKKDDITVRWHSGFTERSVVREWELSHADTN